MTLPSDLLIFLPSASRMCPRTRQFLYEALAEKHRRDGEQRVEPAPRLVDGLADEVRGELPPEPLLAGLALRVAPLGEGHAPRVEPRVEDLGDAGGLLAGLGMPYAHPVYVGPVQVVGDGVYGEFLQLFLTTDHHQCRRRRCARSVTAFPSSARGSGPSLCCSPSQSPKRPHFIVLGDPVDVSRSPRVARRAPRSSARTRPSWRSRAMAFRTASSVGRRARVPPP